MPNYRLHRSTSVHAEWDAHALNMWGDITANPGTTLGDIATRMGLASELVKRMLDALDRAGALWRGHDVAGNEFLWTVVDAASTVIGNLPAARAWADQHDGSTVAQMSIDLSLPEPICVKMAFILQAESDTKLTVI